MRTRNSTVLVTGGLGYIGSYVVPELLERGWKVRILDNRYRCEPHVAARISTMEGVDTIEGDVRYAHMVEAALRGVEAVVHLAAVCMNKSIADPTESLDVNLMGTQNVLDGAARAGVHRIVYASSASVYGNPARLPMCEDDVLAPITPYCVAKAAGEQLLAFYAQRSAMTWLALRFFNVYGPGQPTDAYYTSVINTFVRRIAAGEPPMIDGRGEQSMDFVHVADVARAVGMALDSTETGHVLNIGTGQQTTIAQLADALLRQLGSSQQPIFRPREVLVTQRQASIEAVGDVLGWTPRIDFASGLSELVEWAKGSPELADGR
jgi:UDP-glucose 4-epimerase